MLKLTDLIKYLDASGLKTEADSLLSMAQEQLSLFDLNEEVPGAPGEGDTHAGSESDETYGSEQDRYDLSNIDFAELLIPDSQVEPRKTIMLTLLRALPSRGKQEIIDEVLALQVESFEQATQNYRDVYPELNYKSPEHISPKQVRMPGVTPGIRFTPDTDRVPGDLEALRLESEEYDKAAEKKQEEIVNRTGQKPSSHELQRLVEGEEGIERPVVNYEMLEKRVLEFKNLLSPEKYADMEQSLAILYARIESTRAIFQGMVSEAQEGIPAEPGAPNPEAFGGFDDYTEDLKSRIYYYSYKVLSDSAGKSIFGLKTDNEDRYGSWQDRQSLIKSFFAHHKHNWFVDPESLKDFLEKTPALVEDATASGQGYYRSHWWHWHASITKWHSEKTAELEAYDSSLKKAMEAYKKGLRFLKRLRRDLDRELTNRLDVMHNAAGLVSYIEDHARDELDIVYQDVINTLENQIEPSGRYNYYGEHIGGMGNSTRYGVSSDESEKKDLDLFDINLLFHNKIKMYEVINNFASLILTMVRRTARTVQSVIVEPGVIKAADSIYSEFFYNIFSISEDSLRAIKPEHWKVVKDPGASLDKDIESLLIDSWADHSDKQGGRFKSLFVYPNFVLKDPEVKRLAARSIRMKYAGFIYDTLIVDREKRVYEIKRHIYDMIEEGKISFKSLEGPGLEHVYERIMTYSEGVQERESKVARRELQRRARETHRAEGVLENEFAQAKVSEIHDSYGELIRVLAYGADQGHPVKNSRAFAEPGARAAIEGYWLANAEQDVLAAIMSSSSSWPPRHGSSPRYIAADASGLDGMVLKLRSLPPVVTTYTTSVENMIHLLVGVLPRPGIVLGDDSEGQADQVRAAEAAAAISLGDLISELGVPRSMADLQVEVDLVSRTPNAYLAPGAVAGHLLQDILPEPPDGHSGEDKDRKLHDAQFLRENLIALIDKMKPIDIVSEEKFSEIVEKYSSRGISPPNTLGPHFSEYVNRAKEINVIVNAARDIPGAMAQYRSIISADGLNRIYAGRLSLIGSVGPRGMGKAYSLLGKKLKNKKINFSKLIKNWEKDTSASIRRDADDFTSNSFGQTIIGRRSNRRGYGHRGADESIDGLTDKTIAFYNAASVGIGDLRDPALSVAILIANKFDLSQAQQFEKILGIAQEEFSKINETNFGHAEIKRFFGLIFTNMDGLKGKIAKIYKISSFAHNRGAGLSTAHFAGMIRDPNFKDFGKNNTVNKYFDMCASLSRLGGLASLRRRYQPTIDALLMGGLLSRGFYKRFREAYRVCREGLRIRPNLEGLEGDSLRAQLEIRALMDTVNTELTAITDYASYEEYNKNLIPKDDKLFNLNWEVRDKNFRFRVLKTYDPAHFKVGIDTQCCQRLGGYGEGAAIDSYINPLAGVVLLELLSPNPLNQSKKEWVMAAQSYFHYVPQDEGYILDNVETNRAWIGDVDGLTGYSKEELYAMLAKKVEENFDIKYFLSGKGYSEIKVDSYSSKRLPYDPRDFAWSKKYTDWKSSGSIDLLNPNFELRDIPEGKISRKKKIGDFHAHACFQKVSYNA